MNNTDLIRTDKDALLTALTEAGCQVVSASRIRCGFHDDKHPSSGVYQDDHGVWRFKCQAASCGFNGDIFDVRAKASGRPLEDVLRESSPKPAAKRVKTYATLRELLGSLRHVAEHYRYSDPDTKATDMVVIRIEAPGEPKRFLQAHQMPSGMYAMQAPPKPWPLYNRARVQASDTVVVVEGEKCVHALHDIGIVATTSPGGAGKAEHADWTPLAGKKVCLWPDADVADPKTGRRTGISHMRDVSRILTTLEPAPVVSRVDVDGLGLRDKEDAADYIAQHEDMGRDAIRLTVQSVIQDAEPLGPSGEVRSLLEDTIRGRREPIDWPWPSITGLTRALLPGTVTIICGDPGSSKSFFLLQAAAHWHMQGVAVALFEVEEDRAYHLTRALAQKSKNSRIFDHNWVKRNADEVRQLCNEHSDFLDSFGARIYESTDETVTLDYLSGWVSERAQAGNRIIGIDPITAASYSDKPWIDDLKFLMAVKDTARQFDCSVVLVTHPRKGVKGGTHMEDMAGGAAYARFSQTILWLSSHSPAKEIQIFDSMGFTGPTTEADKTIAIRKSRNGPGCGATVGFTFSGQTLRFDELGVIAGA